MIKLTTKITKAQIFMKNPNSRPKHTTFKSLKNLNFQKSMEILRENIEKDRERYAKYSAEHRNTCSGYKFTKFIGSNTGKYTPAKKVGAVMKACRDYGESVGGYENTNVDDFFVWYLSNILSPTSLLSVLSEILSYHEDADEKIKAKYLTLKQSINIFIYFIIDQTFSGYIAEEKVMDMVKQKIEKDDLEKYGKSITKVEEASDDFDRNYGIDLVVKREGKIVGGIQVKPHTYFLGKREDLIKDREKINPQKYIKFMKEFNAPAKYVDLNKSFESNNLVMFDVRKCKAYVKKVQEGK